MQNAARFGVGCKILTTVIFGGIYLFFKQQGGCCYWTNFERWFEMLFSPCAIVTAVVFCVYSCRASGTGRQASVTLVSSLGWQHGQATNKEIQRITNFRYKRDKEAGEGETPTRAHTYTQMFMGTCVCVWVHADVDEFVRCTWRELSQHARLHKCVAFGGEA